MAGFTDKIKRFFGMQTPLDGGLFDDLTDLLVEGDFGAAEAFGTVETLRALCKKRKIDTAEAARDVLVEILTGDLCFPAPSGGNSAGNAPEGVRVEPGKLTAILLLGVNGVGKTTTAAKLAVRYRDAGSRPILAAADTFRAAAVDQLKLHGERTGIRVVAHRQGGDSAAVIYDALEAARAGAGDLVVADTAGRMHTKAALVEELKKIDRVIESKSAERCLKWLVLDATTGRNALVQAETFHAAVRLDGVILTKTDSTAKGGVVFSLAKSLGLAVVFTANGEKYGDIHPFDAASWVRGFTGLV
ncbi:MAG: signal recognition particle-docking protein FtsY [Spirochaetaceae bacterium]|jgi:fused signal recognition particle receptor|nr:signal recognition particle-docking protein FtsY [Spirochaetaceae bacterium]